MQTSTFVRECLAIGKCRRVAGRGRTQSVDRPARDRSARRTPVIASQPGSNGSQWDLTKVAVTGSILSVQFNVRAGDENLWNPSFPLSDISVVDDATAQRYSPLQDSSGKPMAAPLNSVNDKKLKLDIKKNSNGVIWVKFPAPPATSQTVSINVPEVAPFDGVAIQR